MELDNNEEQLKRQRAAAARHDRNDDDNRTERFGLWWGLGAAGVVTVGVLALALYTSYQDEQPQQAAASAVHHEHNHAHSHAGIPGGEQEAASMALLNSETQAQGMTAPAETASEPEAAVSASAAVTEPAASSPAAVILAETAAADEDAKILVENGVVKFYFASGKSELADGSPEALKDVVAGVREGKKAVVSGYADHTGNAAQNEQLSKERAFKVRDALLGAGIPESSIVMEKPQNHTGSGDKAEARRVEVVLR